VAALSDELAKAERANTLGAELTSEVERRKVARLAAESRVEALRVELAAAEEALAAAADAHVQAEDAAAGFTPTDVAPLRQQIADADTTNAQIRAARDRARLAGEVKVLGEESDALTKRVDDATAAK